MGILDDIEAESRQLIGRAQEAGILLRLLGGLALKIHCQSTQPMVLRREYPDIDLATDKDGGRKAEKLLTGMGYQPNRTFNTLNGDRRLLFQDDINHRQLDIFIQEFQMCHHIPFADRLGKDPWTLPLAELFLTKAQIVQLNHKDLLDLAALLLEHALGSGDDETINLGVIASLCARDWGLYTTTNLTLSRLDTFVLKDIELEISQQVTIRQRILALKEAMKSAPKPFAWKARDKIGTRMRWYEEVEEVQR
jgi:hypothetical protein